MVVQFISFIISVDVTTLECVIVTTVSSAALSRGELKCTLTCYAQLYNAASLD